MSVEAVSYKVMRCINGRYDYSVCNCIRLQFVQLHLGYEPPPTYKLHFSQD